MLSHSPLLPFALTFHLICGFALTIYSILPSFIPKLITSLNHFFIFPIHLLMLFSPPLPFLPPSPSCWCSAVSAVLLVLTNVALILEKCPKIWLVVRDIMGSGLTFSTKCHCRQTNPRYRVEEIDQLFDIRWHTQVTHNIQISAVLNDCLLLRVLLTHMKYQMKSLHYNFTFTDLTHYQGYVFNLKDVYILVL